MIAFCFADLMSSNIITNDRRRGPTGMSTTTEIPLINTEIRTVCGIRFEGVLFRAANGDGLCLIVSCCGACVCWGSRGCGRCDVTETDLSDHHLL